MPCASVRYFFLMKDKKQARFLNTPKRFSFCKRRGKSKRINQSGLFFLIFIIVNKF